MLPLFCFGDDLLRTLGLIWALLLLVVLAGCADEDAKSHEELLSAFSGPLHLSCQRGNTEFQYSNSPEGILCQFRIGDEVMTTELSEGIVETRLMDIKRQNCSLPSSCPVIEITEAVNSFRRQCSAKEPQYTRSGDIYYLGGATAIVEDGKLMSLTTKGGIFCSGAS